MTRRSPSLRTRAALASAAGASVVVLLAAAVVLVLLARDSEDAGVDLTGAAAVTLRTADGSTAPVAGPLLPSVTGVADVAGERYRIRTVPGSLPGSVVSIGLPAEVPAQLAQRRRRLVALVAVGAVLLAAAIAWGLAGRAVAPLRRLAAATHRLGAVPGPPPQLSAPGARESEELAEALTRLLGRVHDEQDRTRRALDSARDFAATARHELRTPLTAMRTDLEVLRDHPGLAGADRDAVLAELLRSHRRLDATLTALGRLAAGEVVDPATRGSVDVVELLRVVAEDARRAHPGLVVDVVATTAVLPGWADGLRIALDTVLDNAVRHGRARRVTIACHHAPGCWTLVVDDDGRGLPPAEREPVLARFTRGSTADGPGSGLGLALVEQQARLHGGVVRLDDSPLGGLRVTIGVGPPTGPAAVPRAAARPAPS